MSTVTLERHKVRLAGHLAKAYKRMSDKEETYKALDENLDKLHKISVEGAVSKKKVKPGIKKRNLTKALGDLRKSMIEVIEAEKMMHFMHRSKTSEEIVFEKRILELENKLNKYLHYRDERIKRLDEINKKITSAFDKKKEKEEEAEKIEVEEEGEEEIKVDTKAELEPGKKMLSAPKTIPMRSLPVSVSEPKAGFSSERMKELEKKVSQKLEEPEETNKRIIADVTKKLRVMKQTVKQLKKNKRYSKKKIAELENKIKKYDIIIKNVKS